MVRYSKENPEENQSIAGYGSGVGQGKVEERVRSGDGPEWTTLSLRRRRLVVKNTLSSLILLFYFD